MAFHVRQETHANSIDRDPTIWVLESEDDARLEVWPALGFNAYRWRVGNAEILYRDPAFFDELKPTRSGWPILFPFPNRIRDGRFDWAGRSFQLPLNDPAGKNTIHGFVATRPWRVMEHGADHYQAWLTAEFQAIRDATDVLDLWPGDYYLRITYRLLFGNRLRIEAAVENVGACPLPYGLGYHPYFRTTPFGGDDATIEIEACRQWKLVDCLPTGVVAPFGLPEQRFAAVHLDHLLTDVPMSRSDARHCGAMESADGLRLVVEASRDFRELVVYTPPHRQAICFEPYTCITDAINLQPQGHDAGLQVLAPGDLWHGWVQATVSDDPTPAA